MTIELSRKFGINEGGGASKEMHGKGGQFAALPNDKSFELVGGVDGKKV